MIRYGGDIPVEHLERLKELDMLENWFIQHGSTIPKLSAAKGFVSIAHDYVMMDMEETAEEFLNRADEICPGYFSGPILTQIAKDPDFASLVGNLTESLVFESMVIMGFEIEQV